MLPGEVELVFEGTGSPGCEVYSALSGLTNRIRARFLKIDVFWTVLVLIIHRRCEGACPWRSLYVALAHYTISAICVTSNKTLVDG